MNINSFWYNAAMLERSEYGEAALKSVDSSESTDSHENLPQIDLEQLNSDAKQRENQRKIHQGIENKDRQKADIELESNLSELDGGIVDEVNLTEFIEKNYSGSQEAFNAAKDYMLLQQSIGNAVSESDLREVLSNAVKEESVISKGDEVIAFKEKLVAKGKSQTEILSKLIASYEGDESVSVWVENWKQMLALHNYAKSNLDTSDQKAVENILSNVDITSENSFDTALKTIASSSEVSDSAKEKIVTKFGNISTIKDMDATLTDLKEQKEKLGEVVSRKEENRDLIKSDISKLEAKLNDPEITEQERSDLEKELAEKKQELETVKVEITSLQEQIPEKISFPLRNGFSAVLNSDGSRSIQIDGLNFVLKIPDNKMPFQGRKNVLTVNTAFTYGALRNSGIESLFNPELNNADVPTRDQRVLCSKILTSLGYPDSEIISELQIVQLNKDLSLLRNKNSNTSGFEDITALGIWDDLNKQIDTNRLTDCLSYINKNRGRDVGFSDLLER